VSIVTVPMTIRSTQRVQQIVRALTRHGLGHLVHRLNLRAYLPVPKKFKPAPKLLPGETERDLARRFVLVCEELGPTFIKLGQMLSTRPDLLSHAMIEELRKLQAHVAPFDSATARKIVETSLGMPLEEAFAHFEADPLASGSIAQTHRAVTRDGQDVVVKIKRPNIEHVIQVDVHILRWLAQNIERRVHEWAVYRPVAIIEEFWQTVTREMDFLREASITNRFSEFFADDRDIVIPSVRWDLTAEQVLTLTRVKGWPFHDALADPRLDLDRPALARKLVEAFLKQYLELGLYQADPHPGNLLLMGRSRIGLVDFGMTSQLDRDRCLQLVSLLVAASSREMDLVVDILAEMATVDPETNLVLLRRDLASLLDKYEGLPIKRFNLQKLFSEIGDLARSHRIKLPRDFVMVGRSLVTIGGVAMELDPELELGRIIRPRIHQMLLQQAKPNNLARELGLTAWHGSHLLRDTPKHLRELIRRGLRGQLSVRLEHQGMDFLVRELDRSSNRLSFAMLLAAIIIGSSLIMHARIGPAAFGLPVLGLTGYLIAGIMALGLLIAIIRSGKLS